MRLSKLQKYIVLQCFDKKYNQLDRKVLVNFYYSFKKKPTKEIQVSNITNSIERLIKKGLVNGYGQFTQTKNFIHKINLTRLGRKIAIKLLGEQKKLPLRLRKNK